MRFMSYEGSFTSDTLISFLEKLVFQSKADRDGDEPAPKYTLILDGHPTHKTKKVQEWLDRHTVIDEDEVDPVKRTQPQIRLYFLPAYSPELNPDEQVWNNVKSQMKGVISISRKDIRKKVCKCLLRIQKKKELISSFFHHYEFV